MTKEEKLKNISKKIELRERLIQTAEEDGAEVVSFSQKLDDTGLLPFLPAQLVEQLHLHVKGGYYQYIPAPADKDGTVIDGKCTYIPDGHGGTVYAIGLSADLLQRGKPYEIFVFLHEVAHVMVKGDHGELFDSYFQMLLDAVNDYNEWNLVRDFLDD